MIKLYFARCSNKLSPGAFSHYLSLLPAELRQRITRFVKWEDQHARLLGKLLLMKAMENIGKNADLFNLKYTSFGRPYFENAPDFNISHAGSGSVCALSNIGRIGVDLEEMKPIAIEDFRAEFSEKEWDSIVNADNPIYWFYYYWTAKEAVVKADGRGLNLPLCKIGIKDNKAEVGMDLWFIKNIIIDNRYMLHIASDKLIDTEIDFAEVNF